MISNPFKQKRGIDISIIILIAIFTVALPFKNSIYQGSLAILYMLVGWRAYKNSTDCWNHTKPFMMIFTAIFISMTISNSLGVSYGYGIESQIRFFWYFVPLFFVLFYILYEKIISVEMLFMLFLTASLFTATLGIAEFVSSGYDLTNRLCGHTFNPNAFSVWLMIAILLLTHIFLQTKSTAIAITVFLVTIVCAGELVLTQSRAAWFGIFIGLLVYVSLNRNSINKTRLALAVISVTLMLVLFWFESNAFQDRIHTILNGNTSRRSNIIWPWAIETIKQAPFFGHGLNSMRLIRLPTIDEVLPHNIYLELLLFLGIVGFVCFAWLFTTVATNIKTSLATNRQYSAILGGVFASLLTDGFFDQSITMSLYFVSLIITIASISVYLSNIVNFE